MRAKGKGKKERMLPMGEQASRALALYLKQEKKG